MLTGKTLRAIREIANITQSELAQKSGVSQAAISLFEVNKRHLRTDTVRKLLQVLAVKVTYTVNGTTVTGP